MRAMQLQHTVGEAELCLLGRVVRRGEAGRCHLLERRTWGGVADRSVDVGRQEPGDRNTAAPCPGACPQVTVGIAFHISMLLFILPPFACDLFRAEPSTNTCFYSDLHCEALILLEASSHDCNTNDKSSS